MCVETFGPNIQLNVCQLSTSEKGEKTCTCIHGLHQCLRMTAKVWIPLGQTEGDQQDM